MMYTPITASSDHTKSDPPIVLSPIRSCLCCLWPIRGHSAVTTKWGSDWSEAECSFSVWCEDGEMRDVRCARLSVQDEMGPALSTEHRGPGIHLQSTHTIWEPAKLIFKVRCGDSTVNTSIQADGQTDLRKPLYWPIRRDGSRQRWSCSPLVKSRLSRSGSCQDPKLHFYVSPLIWLARARSTTRGHCAAQTKVTTLAWSS